MPEGMMTWHGDRPLCLDCANRYLVVVHAVCDGKCALFDTKTGDLTPFGQVDAKLGLDAAQAQIADDL
jgi:hypothetical protein